MGEYREGKEIKLYGVEKYKYCDRGGGVMSNYMKCGCADIQGPKLSGQKQGRG